MENWHPTMPMITWLGKSRRIRDQRDNSRNRRKKKKENNMLNEKKEKKKEMKK